MSKYLVVGLGKSGIAAAGLLKKNGKEVILYDGNESFDKDAFYENNSDLGGMDIVIGTIPEEVMKDIDTAVLSPGVPTDGDIATKLKDAGIRLTGEIELAYSFGHGDVLAITGTNGKTTTTSLVGELMEREFSDVRVVGNIGIPYTGMVDGSNEETVMVAEISSFQLETADTFRPRVSAILNITPDHLDRHHGMAGYIAAKESITKNQTEDDTCVLNYEDEELRRFGETLKCNVIWFSSARVLLDGYYYEDGMIYGPGETEIIAVADLRILGIHNYENVMAAVAMAEAYGATRESIVEGLKAFNAVEHRIEFICEKRGVAFYNDSKGTNPDAAIKAIQAMERPTYLIGGGYDKDSTYDEWIEAFGDKVKKLVLIGATAQKIAACADAHGFKDYCFADTLESAMDICFDAASDGDAILLSPACASWDMFKNYEVRGDLFREHALSYR
ncbi:MAG: UDP-N-acetylmuramoyl-L-alanine--D-glutamate ligase [Lachnospiraceae bacterium]|nr:UDP-N-acetylmuramoyl-L-alanine--D-glutamate ligase [Lachnospiraceae bacterium]